MATSSESLLPPPISEPFYGLTNNTKLITLFVKSSATCLKDLPANLTEIQKKYFVYECLRHRVRLDCILRNKDRTRCKQALRLIDLRDCSVLCQWSPGTCEGA